LRRRGRLRSRSCSSRAARRRHAVRGRRVPPGLAYLGEQKPIDAAAAFVLAKKLDPSRTVDEARFVPEVVRAFEAAGGPVRTSPRPPRSR